MASLELWLERALVVFIGCAGGLVVGSALVAFLTVLDVIPRLAQISRTYGKVYLYEFGLTAGAVFWAWIDFSGWVLPLPGKLWVTGAIGLMMGCFIGMLAAGLTEVLNVLPILSRRLGLADHLVFFLFAMVAGKVIGSLFDWVIFQMLP